MTDIVKRLRAANTTLNEGDCCGQLDASGTCMAPACIFGEALKMTHEAADEITRLREALREIDEIGRVAAQVPGPRNKLMEICARARAAMGGGDE